MNELKILTGISRFRKECLVVPAYFIYNPSEDARIKLSPFFSRTGRITKLFRYCFEVPLSLLGIRSFDMRDKFVHSQG